MTKLRNCKNFLTIFSWKWNQNCCGLPQSLSFHKLSESIHLVAAASETRSCWRDRTAGCWWQQAQWPQAGGRPAARGRMRQLFLQTHHVPWHHHHGPAAAAAAIGLENSLQWLARVWQIERHYVLPCSRCYSLAYLTSIHVPQAWGWGKHRKFRPTAWWSADHRADYRGNGLPIFAAPATEVLKYCTYRPDIIAPPGF